MVKPSALHVFWTLPAKKERYCLEACALIVLYSFKAFISLFDNSRNLDNITIYVEILKCYIFGFKIAKLKKSEIVFYVELSISHLLAFFVCI